MKIAFRHSFAWSAHRCESVHPAKSKCASRYSGVHGKIWTRAFRYSGGRTKMYESCDAGRASFVHRKKLPKGCARADQIRVWLELYNDRRHVLDIIGPDNPTCSQFPSDTEFGQNAKFRKGI